MNINTIMCQYLFKISLLLYVGFIYIQHTEAWKQKKVIAKLVIASSLFMNRGQAMAAYDVTKSYSNGFYHTKFDYPASYDELKGQISGGRVVTSFRDPQDADTSVSVVFNPIPGDFTSLNSFGGSENLKQYLIPKGASLLRETRVGDTFTVEYSSTDPDSDKERHVISVFALRPAEIVIGLIIQSPESRYESVKDELNAIAASLNTNVKN